MKKYKIITLIGCMLMAICISCDDVLEEDISDEEVVPFSPLQGNQIDGNTVNFQWSFVEDADAYRLQVQNDIQNIGLVLDSLVPATSLQVNLPSGNYAWTVRAENFAYVTPFFESTSFSVVFSDDLASQSVTLSTPSNSLFTNNTTLIYTWEALAAADSYDFELLRVLNGTTTVTQENTVMTSIQVDNNVYEEDAQYLWRVKAINDESQTTFSERSVFIDRSVPEAPTLGTPAQDAMFDTDTIDFDWSIGADTGNVQSERSSVIEFSETEDFETLIDTVTVNVSETTYTFTNTGVIYWRVRVDDVAGNMSAYSEITSFMIN
ncbi:hypothetical protein [Dokdonia sp.]|uniref:hypothetical protein n=1 Tax=Dokdonia sp. TaxID=2024995 RepID=UPI003265DE59